MPRSRPTQARDFAQGEFPPHGQMQLQLSGQLNVLEATGPFNKELVVAGDAAQQGLYEALQKTGRWGTVLIFRESALISLEALAEITATLQRRKAQGYVPVAVALVFGPEVQGASLLQSHYLQAYRAAGIEGQLFTDVQAAKDWVTARIQAS